MKKLGTDARLKKKLQEILDLNIAENAAMDNANNPSASNPFATMADITDLGLDSDELAAIGAANSPSVSNPFATIADSPEKVIDVTYDELVALMDSSGDGLVPGQFYRITDFATAHYMTDYDTATEDINTGSTEPLIVLAISESDLDSRAYSELYPYDVIHYDWNPTNWLTDISFGGNDETLVTGFKGVIYFRHDTLHDNYMGYDFRNVKFRRWNNGSVVGAVWISEYQAYKSTGDGVTDVEDYIDVLTFNCPGGEEQYNVEVRSVHIEPFKDQTDLFNMIPTLLNNNVFHLKADYGWYQVFITSMGFTCVCNTFNGYLESNIIGNYFNYNTIGNNFNANTIGNDFYYNTIGNNFNANTIGNDFNYNTIGNDFNFNTIGNDFYYNTIGDDFNSNTIGNKCDHLTIADSSYNIKIGQGSSYIELGDSTGGVSNIDIGQGCGGSGKDIVIGGLCKDISLGNSCKSITIVTEAETLSFGNNCGVNGSINIDYLCWGISFENGCSNINIGQESSNISIGNMCGDIIIGAWSGNLVFESGCMHITLPESSWYNTFLTGCAVLKDFTDSSVVQLNDIHVTHRISGTKLVGTYLEEQSDGSFVEVHAEDIIGVAV